MQRGALQVYLATHFSYTKWSKWYRNKSLFYVILLTNLEQCHLYSRWWCISCVRQRGGLLCCTSWSSHQKRRRGEHSPGGSVSAFQNHLDCLWGQKHSREGYEGEMPINFKPVELKALLDFTFSLATWTGHLLCIEWVRTNGMEIDQTVRYFI